MSNVLLVVMVISNVYSQVFIITIFLITVHVGVYSSSWLPSKKLLLEEELCRTQNRRHKRDLFGIAGTRQVQIAKARQAHLLLGDDHQARHAKKPPAVIQKRRAPPKQQTTKYPVCYTFPASKYPICYTFPNDPQTTESFFMQGRDMFPGEVTEFFLNPTNFHMKPTKNIMTTQEYTTVAPSSTQTELSSTQTTYSSTSSITTKFSTTAYPTTSSVTTEFSTTSYPTISSITTELSTTAYPTTSSYIPTSTEFTTMISTSTESIPSTSYSTLSSNESEFTSTSHTPTTLPFRRSIVPTFTEYTTDLSSSTEASTSTTEVTTFTTEATTFTTEATTITTEATPFTTEATTFTTEATTFTTEATTFTTEATTFTTEATTFTTEAITFTTEATTFTTEATTFTTEATTFTTEAPTYTSEASTSTTETTTYTSEDTPSTLPSTTEYTTFLSSSAQSTYPSTQYPSSSASSVTIPTTNPIQFISTILPITTEYITSPFSSSPTLSSTDSPETTHLSTTETTLSTSDFETTTQSPLVTIPIPITNPIFPGSTGNIWKPPLTTTECSFSSETYSSQLSTTEMPFQTSTPIYTTESTPISSEYTECSTTESPLSTEEYTTSSYTPTSNTIMFGTTNFPFPEASTTESYMESTTEFPTTEFPTTEFPTTEFPTTEFPTTEEPPTEKPTTKVPTTKKPPTKIPTTKTTTTTEPTTTDESLIPRTPPPTLSPSECPKHDTNTLEDRCACFSDNHCRVDENGRVCLSDHEICQRYHPDPEKECIRTPTGEQAEVFYIYAGTPCPKNKIHRRKRSINFLRRYRIGGLGSIGTLVDIPKDSIGTLVDIPKDHSHAISPHCKVEETLLAVNLGRDQKHVDGYGIQYMADNEVPWIDPNNTRKNDISLHLNGVDKKDMWLYRWQIWGDWTKKGIGHCVVYEVPLGKDGRHELNMKMIDNYWGRKGTRGFNVRFNSITILPEIDLIHTTQKQFRAVDMVLNFEVTEHGKQLIMPGYPNSEIHDGFVELKFCYGECNSTDEDYHVAGFSVVRFAKPDEDSSCNQFRRLPCLCKQHGCQFHLETGDCRKQEECPGRMFRHNECKRVNTFYSNGGVLCLNQRGSGSCLVGETIKAINFHGEATDDRRTGIMYASDRNIEIGRLIDFAPKCSEVNTKAKELYCFYTEANLDTLTKEKCLEYNMPIKKDGSYELSFKMGEFKFDHRGDRTFNIKLNGEVILKELDILAVAKKNQAIDINILFTVLGNGNIIWMNGYSLRRINGKIKLQFCNGEWSKRDGSWILSAFSVVRFEYSFRNTSAYTFSA